MKKIGSSFPVFNQDSGNLVRTAVSLVVVLTALALPALGQEAKGNLTVMTYNVNEGTDFLQVVGATNAIQFLLGVGDIVTQVQGTNPPERMQAVAAQILAAHPTLVSLQEVDQWYQGPFDPLTGTCGTLSLKYDMLAELTAALAAQGGHYQVVLNVPEIMLPATPGLILPDTFLCASVTDYNVILARTDINPQSFRLSNAQSGQFVAAVPFTTPFGVVPITRSWVSVDVKFHASKFRFIGTHLESFVPPVREAQGAELRIGPANTALPVIVAMDSNAQAFPLPQDPTYVDFIASGYNDVWSEIFPSAPGLTCCQNESDDNPVSELYQRIDVILTLGDIEGQKIALFGADPSTRTPDGLWPSDHAGVAASVTIEEE
jgi:endonuclease/exonuclease/phosphatase family metal-dependent hydrolase